MSLLDDAGKKEIIGVIDNKFPMKSDNEKAPKGHFLVNSLKYTCWDSEEWNAFNTGDKVLIKFKESKWNGNINRNITEINDMNGQEELPDEIKVTEEKIVSTPLKEKKEEKQEVEKEEKKEEIIPNEIGPDPEEYYIVMKGRKYKLMPL